MTKPAPRGGTFKMIMSGVVVLALALTAVSCGGTGEGGGEGNGRSQTMQEVSGAERYVLPGEQVFPEGVAYRADTGDFYVGSTTDGTVFQGNVEGGSKEAEVFLEPESDGRTTAIGMEVDEEGRLFIAGGATGRIFVYDTESGDQIGRLDTPDAEATFLNDVAVTPDGDAYVTDSLRPVLFRVPSTADGVGEAEPWLNFEGTPAEYEEGFNLNGIDATEDGRYLVAVQSNTGELFRIDIESKEVIEIDRGRDTLTNGDGLLLDGRTVYVVRNEEALIVPIKLSGEYNTGEVGESFTDPSFAYPTTIAKTDGRLLVVNSQFDKQEGEAKLPFTVSNIEVP
ncbi:MAG TPA: SMP-30/gluconolactonase/LRE family protein [Rubrobacter sp.]|nr:SMP-30/gluconolactonase/LRE family protein [Rubrobacter sp.]